MEYSTKIHRHSFDYVTMYMWIAEMQDLNQNEKLIFSKIYNFCKSKNQRFYGSLEYLSKQTAMCTRSVCIALKTLKEKKLVFKDVEEVSFGKAKSCYYINDDEIVRRTGLTIEQLNKITVDSLRNRIKDFEEMISKLQSENEQDSTYGEPDSQIINIEEANNLELSKEESSILLDCDIENHSQQFNSILNSSIKTGEEKSIMNESVSYYDEPIVMDFKITKKGGFLQSSVNKKPKATKINRDNKYMQFVEYARQSNYPDGVMESVIRYVKWLLGNRKVSLEQWKLMIDGLNKELCQLATKEIREEAALDAFNSAFASGYQKLFIDKYKYAKYNQKSLRDMGVDIQKSNSKIEEVSTGVYRVVGENKDFVTDENGNPLTF